MSKVRVMFSVANTTSNIRAHITKHFSAFQGEKKQQNMLFIRLTMLNTVYPLISRVSRAEDFFLKTAKKFLQKEKHRFSEKKFYFSGHT